MSFYITVNREPKMYQLTFDDIMNGIDYASIDRASNNASNTITWSVERIKPELSMRTDFASMESALNAFIEKYRWLIEIGDKSSLYRSFKIPKRSGGLRQIDAPNDELKMALYDLKFILEKKFYMTHHTSAFAYVKGRSTLDAVKRHQQNKSRWFLKTDMKNFFPSISPAFLMDMLCRTFPFCEFVSVNPDNRATLEKALSLCFLNGGLPQGTPTSPMLTNAIMIPIDYEINKMCHKHVPRLCYTRYADDILISSEYSFNWTEVRDNLISILNSFNAPFTLHPTKTRYGSSSGRNWNLGLMLNAENKITIGHEKKKVFKAMVFQFMADYRKGNTWRLEDVQHLMGLVSYYRMVERDSINEILAFYSQKFNKNVEDAIKESMSISSAA